MPPANGGDLPVHTIRIANVPEATVARLKAHAASAGLSLEQFLLREFAALAERPTVAAFKARLAALSPVSADLSPAEAVRAERGEP